MVKDFVRTKFENDVINMAQRFVKQGRMMEAIVILEKFTKSVKGKKNPLAWDILADFYKQQAQIDLAVKAFICSARMYIREGYFSVAVARLHIAKGLDANCEKIRKLLIESYHKMGLSAEASGEQASLNALWLAKKRKRVYLERHGDILDDIKYLAEQCENNDQSAKRKLGTIANIIAETLHSPKVPAKKKHKK